MSNPFAQSTINIGGDQGDTFHRYKMPSIDLVKEHKNGGSCVITNINEIAGCLNRDSNDLRQFFSKALSRSVRLIKSKGLVFVGDQSQAELQSILSDYINVYVLCHKCHNPETSVEQQKKHKIMICGACGHQTRL